MNLTEYRTETAVETQELAATVYERCQAEGRKVILLSGEPGAGKTIFSQGVGLAFGLTSKIPSPSFSIYNQHHNPRGGLLTHLDLYRLGSDENGADGSELLELGLGEIVNDSDFVLCEWWQRARGFFLEYKELCLVVDIAYQKEATSWHSSVEDEPRLVKVYPPE